MPAVTVISLVDADNLPLLESEGKAAAERSFADEYADQRRGEHSIFIATEDGRLIGSGFIRWLGPRDSDARALCPDAPEIFRLEVIREYQSRGVGTRLIEALSEAAQEKGFDAVSLGVAHDNPRAYTLYQRLGFLDTDLVEYYDEYRYPLEEGGWGVARDLCRYLVKPLGGGRRTMHE